jgi:signal transduction histidine kinase/CheY-like chemotaxis protein
MPDSPNDNRSPIREERKQHLRTRRYLQASAFSLLYLVVLAIFHNQGKIDDATLVEACALVGGLILAFFALFRLGLNLRFRDPSLTAMQVLAAVFTMLFVFYRAPDTRLVFAAFFFVALMFGMLRANWTQLTVLGCVSLAAFAGAAWARYLATGEAEVLRLDLLQLLVMAVAFPWFVFIGGRVKVLGEAGRRKDDFLATLSHELRNPLSPIRAGIHILRLPDGLSQAATILPMMERQLHHLTHLLDDLLDASRIARGKLALQVEPIDLGEAVQAAVEANRALIGQMRHELTVSLPAEPVTLEADPVRLAQVFSNLLNNAAKYTPPGGRIGLTGARQGDAVEVTVSDNGVGISREHLASIFDMFTQIEAHASKSQGGLGIGLALVKSVVALHGGAIEVRSEGQGRGSEFRIRLPVRSARAPAPPAPPGRRPERRRMERQRVLVVDDNADVASTLSTVAQLLGHEVRVAHGGEAALALAEGFRPQTILLDLGMPGVDGYDVCRRIRAQSWGKEVKVIAVTGWGQKEDRLQSAAAGFDEHLVKPVAPGTLVELLGDLRSRP